MLEAWKLEGWEARRLGGWEVGKLGSWEVGKPENNLDVRSTIPS
ncbi:hypothetical protein D1AOALGA4SA_8796 [Olavius algarvensis Delta 1 endosymbiont]|nr:hypothetical protein D1AOALGA4SA_8796 [Olavius algarvensis Delta 1 endosymbiont]